MLHCNPATCLPALSSSEPLTLPSSPAVHFPLECTEDVHLQHGLPSMFGGVSTAADRRPSGPSVLSSSFSAAAAPGTSSLILSAACSSARPWCSAAGRGSPPPSCRYCPWFCSWPSSTSYSAWPLTCKHIDRTRPTCVCLLISKLNFVQSVFLLPGKCTSLVANTLQPGTMNCAKKKCPQIKTFLTVYIIIEQS